MGQSRPAPLGWRLVLATPADATLSLLRLTLGVVMFPHGAQKLLGWFGGYGFEGTMQYLTGQAGLAAPIALIVVLTESIGSLLLALGLGTRAVSLSLIAVMIGAIAEVHGRIGFFMNWSGQQAGEGFEYHLLVIAMAAVLAIRGAGAWSLDRTLARQR